ncbi:hypothetical protein ACJJIX_17050 [Microbulbifer sp. VAAC004]|uniref:hypothetical protein n=1 Tax=unclassified Microbulbifer TaxID=2619833 RepID=UPI00403A7F57
MTLSTQSFAKDSDGDGLEDHVEQLIGLNPNNSDSDQDGILDPDEFYEFRDFIEADTGRTINRDHFLVNPSIDSDEDQITDFTEVYGYYNDGNLLRGAQRAVPSDIWLDMRDNSSHNVILNGITIRTTRWAIKALEAAGKVTTQQLSNLDTGGEQDFRVLIVDGMYDIIRSHVISKLDGLGVANPETHQVITGSPREDGTIASVMAAIMINSDSFGPAREIFFTDPFRYSTDFDPYSDREEAIGIFGASQPVHGASHPLIGAMPQLVTTLEGITLYDMTTIGESNGTEVGEEIGEYQTKENSQTKEKLWFVTLNFEGNAGTDGLSIGVNTGGGYGQSTGWSSSEAIETGSSTFESLSSETSTEVSNSCFSSMALTLKVTNTGSDAASQIFPFWDIYFGDQLWGTVDYEGNGFSLAAGQSERLVVLGRSEEGSCLSVEETDYLANGGAVGLATNIASAKVTLFNNATGQLNNNADWSALINSFNSDLARISVKGVSANGSDFNHNIWVHAYDEGSLLPDMSVTIKEAFDIAYTQLDCKNSGYTDAALCYRTSEGDFIIGGDNDRASSFEFTFTDSNFNVINDPNFVEQLTSKNNSSNFWDIRLPPKTTVTITQQIPLYPIVKNYDIFQLYGDNGITNNIEVHAVINDHLGIKSVEICDGNQCNPLKPKLESGERSNNYFKSVNNISDLGNLTLKVENTLGNISETPVSPTAVKYSKETQRRITFAENYAISLSQHLKYYEEEISSTDKDYYIRMGLISDIDTLREKVDGINNDAFYLSSVCDNNLNTITQCFDSIDKFDKTYLSEEQVLFNLNKMPIRNRLLMPRGQTPSFSGDVDCAIPSNSIIVGMKAKSVIRAPGTDANLKIGIFSREILPTYKPQEPFFIFNSTVESCDKYSGNGNMHFYDFNFVDGDNTKAYAFTNFGLDVDNGQVNKLCVGRHKVDLSKKGPLTSTGSHYSSICGNSDSWSGIERRTSSTPTTTRGLPYHLTAEAVRATAKSASFYRVQMSEIVFAQPYTSGLTNGYRYRIKNVETGNYLDKRSGDNDIVDISPRNDDDLSQIWILDAVNPLEFRIISASQNTILTQPNSLTEKFFTRAIPNNDQELESNYSQHFRLESLSGGANTIKSVYMNNKYMSAAGNLSNASTSTKWLFERVTD